MSNNKNKGIREYTGEEASNVSLSQLGWVKVTNSNEHVCGPCPLDATGAVDPAANTNYYPDINQFVAVKNADHTANMTLTLKGPGVSAGTSINLSSKEVNTDGNEDVTAIDLVPGDIIYGPFTSVKKTAGTGQILLIKG
mgnify:CR=1 FL=1|tara:strand:- start:6416 stop:6832 length:417 start_codon:yes stop_codon:yes gene_type:complete